MADLVAAKSTQSLLNGYRLAPVCFSLSRILRWRSPNFNMLVVNISVFPSVEREHLCMIAMLGKSIIVLCVMGKISNCEFFYLFIFFF